MGERARNTTFDLPLQRESQTRPARMTAREAQTFLIARGILHMNEVVDQNADTISLEPAIYTRMLALLHTYTPEARQELKALREATLALSARQGERSIPEQQPEQTIRTLINEERIRSHGFVQQLQDPYVVRYDAEAAKEAQDDLAEVQKNILGLRSILACFPKHEGDAFDRTEIDAALRTIESIYATQLFALAQIIHHGTSITRANVRTHSITQNLYTRMTQLRRVRDMLYAEFLYPETRAHHS